MQMRKENARKITLPKGKLQKKKICKADYRAHVMLKHTKRNKQERNFQLDHKKVQSLLNESLLQCPVCLQIFLKPVIAQCGHIFCLPCVEELAQNHYACGICHNNEPTYDINFDKALQQLVYVYLSKCTHQERLNYQKRQKQLQEKQERRSIGMLEEGKYVDFWCLEQKCWKNGAVKSIQKNGTVKICEVKLGKEIKINILSRRLAKYHHYTIDDTINLDFSIMNGSQPSHFFRPMPIFFNILGFDDNEAFRFGPRYNNFQF